MSWDLSMSYSTFVVYAFRTVPSVRRDEGRVFHSQRTGPPLNPESAYLGSPEELQERISGYWSPPCFISQYLDVV